MASPRFRDTGRFVRRKAPAKTYTPANLERLMRCLDPARKVATPIRIRGAGTAATDCNTCSTGSIIDMTGLDRIVRIDNLKFTVTAEAGVRLGWDRWRFWAVGAGEGRQDAGVQRHRVSLPGWMSDRRES